MSTQVRNVGWTVAGSNLGSATKKAVLETSGDTTIMVVPDFNVFTATGGDKDGFHKFHIYESNVARTSWTHRLAFTVSGSFREGALFAAEIFSNNDIGIVYQDAAFNTKYYRVTYATWLASAVETIHTASSTAQSRDMDITISDADVPSVSLYLQSTTNGVASIRIYVRRTSDNTWFNGLQTTVSTSAIKTGSADTAILSIKGGTAAARRWILAYSITTAATDSGVRLRHGTLDEATGAVTDFATIATVGAGELTGGAASYSYRPRSTTLYASATSEFTYAITLARTSNPLAHSGRYTFSGAWNTTVADTVWTSAQADALPAYGMGATYGADVLTIFFINKSFYGESSVYGMQNVLFKYSRGDAPSVEKKGAYVWDNFKKNVRYPFGGGGRNVSRTYASMGFAVYISDTDFRFNYHRASIGRAPASFTPASNSVITTSAPTVTANLDLDVQDPQSDTKVQWQFATDSLFTTNLKSYTQPDRKLTYVADTNKSGVFVKVTDTLPVDESLSQRLWHSRARQIDEWGNAGSWTATQTFTVSHPPSAKNLSPGENDTTFYGSGVVRFNWEFSDSYGDDSQSALEVQVQRVSDSLSIHASGKVIDRSESYLGFIGSAHQDVLLRWRVRLWDEDDVVGSWSSWVTFTLTSVPVITITKPTAGGVIASPKPTIEFTVDTGPKKSLKAYRIVIKQSDGIVHDSGYIRYYGTGSTPYSFAYDTPKSLLDRNQAYTVRVFAIDSSGLEEVQSQAFTTAWTPPAAPTGQTVSIASYNTEGSGYVRISWSDAARDADFKLWRLFRKTQLIDAFDGSVIKESEWEVLDEVYNPNPGGYSYDDYYAPSGYRVIYRVNQVISRFGEEVMSDNFSGIVNDIKSEGYWLVDPRTDDPSGRAFKLHIVTGDAYTEEYEESEFVIIGKGRHVDRGSRIGIKGTLDAQIRDTPGGRSARQKKNRLETLKKDNRHVFLRTPFGDSYWVSVGNLSVTRIPGVGTAEFVDVQLPYSEVAN